MSALERRLDVGQTGRKALAEPAQAALFVLVQVVGCCLGVVLANLMHGLDAVSASSTERSGGGLWLGEVVATCGLVIVVFGGVRSGRAASVALAVGGCITAAYWFTSSTSFANPAITAGRTLSDTFAGIAPSSAPVFVAMQLVGGALGLLAAMVLYPSATQAAVRLTHLPGDDRTLEEAP